MTKKKPKPEKVDGLGPIDRKKLRTAIRQVWAWSHPRMLCIKRATDPEGFGICEQCKTKVPKVYPDHINPVGPLDSGFIEKMFVPSGALQALCKKCHAKKTREDAKRVSQV